MGLKVNFISGLYPRSPFILFALEHAVAPYFFGEWSGNKFLPPFSYPGVFLHLSNSSISDIPILRGQFSLRTCFMASQPCALSASSSPVRNPLVTCTLPWSPSGKYPPSLNARPFLASFLIVHFLFFYAASPLSWNYLGLLSLS